MATMAVIMGIKVKTPAKYKQETHWASIAHLFSLPTFYKGFCSINLCCLRVWPFGTPGTSFEQSWISWSYGYSMPNINAFRPVV